MCDNKNYNRYIIITKHLFSLLTKSNHSVPTLTTSNIKSLQVLGEVYHTLMLLINKTQCLPAKYRPQQQFITHGRALSGI